MHRHKIHWCKCRSDYRKVPKPRITFEHENTTEEFQIYNQCSNTSIFSGTTLRRVLPKRGLCFPLENDPLRGFQVDDVVQLDHRLLLEVFAAPRAIKVVG